LYSAAQQGWAFFHNLFGVSRAGAKTGNNGDGIGHNKSEAIASFLYTNKKVPRR
jgi:hypothetical protein